jgi:hypothetical protein
MKRLLSAIALAVAAFAASASPATGTLTLNGYANGSSSGTVLGYGVPVSAGIGGLDATFVDTSSGSGTFSSFGFDTVFCVDLFSHAGAFGRSIVYDKVLNADATNLNNVTALSKLFTFNGGVTSVNATASAALQLAVWELLYDGEGGSLSTGNFKSGSVNAAVVTAANTLLVGAATSTAGYDITLFTDNAYRTKPTYQDFITATQNFGGSCTLGNCDVTPVPEPTTLSLAMAGLGVIGFGALRRRRA